MLTLLRSQLQQTNSSAAPCYRNLHFCISKSNCFPLMRKKKCCYSKDICPNIHMIFQQPFIMKSWLLQQQQLWSYSLAGSDYAPLVCHPPCNSPNVTPGSSRGLCTSRFGRAGNDHPWQWDSCHIYKWTKTRANTQCHCDWWAVQKCKCNCWQFRKCKCIVKLKKACIFISFYLDVELQQDVYQIGVGIIEHIKVTQYTQKLLLKFCPLKVVPAKGVLDSKSSSWYMLPGYYMQHYLQTNIHNKKERGKK